MVCKKTNQPQGGRHHFLYHIFKMDKAAHPMPENRVAGLLQQLKNICKCQGGT